MKQRGFTLVELLVVMALIGLLSVMIMVNFRRGNHTNDLRQAGTELLQNIRMAQQYTIGGNSMYYCGIGSTYHEYYPCQNDDNCCLVSGECSGACKNRVPAGGYGLFVSSINSYQIFGDTNNDGILGQEDYTVVNRELSLKSTHISAFKLGTQPSMVPTTANFIVVRFSPPEGTVHFYDGQTGTESQAMTLTLLVSSINVTNSCRRIIINRVSGQVSEQQAGCSL